MISNVPSFIRECIDKAKVLEPKPFVYLVANIVGHFDWIYDHSDFPSDEQAYTEQELENFSNSIRKLGFPVEIFFSENAFFQHVLSIKDKSKLDGAIFYNMAEGGKGAGQKSLVPAFARFYGMKICNSSAYSSSLCHHKYHVNQLLRHNGVPAPQSWCFDTNASFRKEEPPNGMTVIVKPVYESMCLGVEEDSMFQWRKESCNFLKEKLHQLQQPLIVQEYIEGFEICCPIVGIEKANSLGLLGFSINNKQILSQEFKIYKGAIKDDYGVYEPNFDSNVERQIVAYGEETFQLLDMEGVGRIDFRVTREGKMFIFDTNESPPPKPNTALHSLLKKNGLSDEEALQAFFAINIPRLFKSLPKTGVHTK